MKIKHKYSLQAKSDLLPLMDCMFILLIYFIFSMMMMIVNVAMPVSLPKLESSNSFKEVYSIQIKNDSSIVWNKSGESISINDLKTEIESIIEFGHLPSVFISVEKDTPYHAFISVLDLTRWLNLKNITIDTGLTEEVMN